MSILNQTTESTAPLTSEALKTLVIEALEDVKAENIVVLDVRETAGFTDYMIVASGSAQRQVKALAQRVLERCQQHGLYPLGVEGEREAEWVLVDLADVVVHVMLPATREFYGLEKLWSVGSQPTDDRRKTQQKLVG